MLNPADSTSQLQNRGFEFDVPDEIAVEILSRLRAVDVLRLRSVCKRWRDLTSSRSFTRLHLRRCLPMLLLDDYYGKICGSDHYLLDQWWEPQQTKTYQFGKVSEFELLFSNGGLVVMRNYTDFVIMNPMYHKKVQIKFSEELLIDDLCGVFFNPSLEEYCTLWRTTVSEEFAGPSVDAVQPEYKILTLGSKPCWREINNPWSHIPRVTLIPPILTDEHLYLAVKDETDPNWNFAFDILEFDIRKEEFTFISSPVPGPFEGDEYDINLLDNGGLLSLVRTFQVEDSPTNKPFEVNIWTLKDRARQLWTASSYIINTDSSFLCRRPKTLVNHELVLHDCGAVFTCNLKLHTVRQFGNDLGGGAFLTTHLMSLASLRYCKSEIYMDKKGEVEKSRKRRRRDILGGDDENPVPIGE